MSQFFLNNKTVVIASHNAGKILEFESLLNNHNIHIITASDINAPDVEEVGKTFKENSILKAKSIPDEHISISDDSGLCVDALDGFPGIYSARFAKKNGGWYEAMNKLYKLILQKKVKNFNASFYCVITLKWYDKWIKTFSGRINGHITWPPRGSNGFGYDPFFIPAGFNQTFGEMIHKEKIKLDHRYVAFKKLSKLYLIDN